MKLRAGEMAYQVKALGVQTLWPESNPQIVHWREVELSPNLYRPELARTRAHIHTHRVNETLTYNS